MRFRKTVPLLLVVLLLASFCACALRGGKSIPVDMLRRVPINSTSLAFWEINTLGTDEVLENIYNKFKDSAEINQLREVGVRRSDVEQSCRVSGFGQSTVTIFSGKLDTNAIEIKLDQRGDYEREDYELDHNQGASIWIPDDTEANRSIAVRDNIVLMGDRNDIVKCIDAIALDQEFNLNDDADITAVVDRLPEGALVYVNKAGADPEEDYTDLIVYGKSYTKQGDNELKLTAVYMFEDYNAAGDAQDAIKAYLSDNGFKEPKIERLDQIYIQATAVINTTDFVNTLDW